MLLPHVGDDFYSLSFAIGSVIETHILHAGDQFLFPTGGVGAFSVRGIELSAGLDPTDSTAFITGLTFVNAGNFTGTMTPVTEAIPEPETYAMMLAGLGLLGLAARRRKQKAE